MTDFDKYIRQGEPDRREKAQVWQTAIGLQDVDGLKPSEYLFRTAGRHIEGDITIDEVKHLIDSYYRTRKNRLETENTRTEEADKVSARITEMLSERSFYPSLDADQALKHICKFVSDICHDGVFGTVFQKSAVRREKRTA